MQLQEAVQRGLGLGFFAGLVLGIGFFQLGLLGQRCARGAAFELFEQRHGLVEGAGRNLVTCFGVDPVGSPFGCGIFLDAGASRQQARSEDGRKKRQRQTQHGQAAFWQ
ncbi:hypothetical protein D3C78_1398960 [compost metagenome]